MKLSARRPVWIALSELFLDTDIRLAYVSIAQALADSPYSLEELRQILDEEVTPVLQGNLCQVAGEWCGFDEEWLVEQVSARVGKRRWLPALVDLSGDWRVVSALVSRLREVPDPARRATAWRHLIRPFLHLDPGPPESTGYTPAEDEVILRQELWPLLIDSVRQLAKRGVYPDEAAVEANWLRRQTGGC